MIRQLLVQATSRRQRLAASALLIVSVAGSNAVAQGSRGAPPDAIDQVLVPRLTRAFQGDVMVLGTTHLASERERLRASHLEPLLERLAAFAPTRIAIEALTADEIALLEEREPHDSTAKQVLDMYGRAALNAGRAAQAVLGISRVAADRQARELLSGREAPDAPTRLRATALLLAAYEFNSAALQWSYLAPEVRAGDTLLTPAVRDLLERRLQSANEIVTLAMPLARRAGLQVLEAMDSQYDGLRTLSLPPDVFASIFRDPARGALVDTARSRHVNAVREAAFAAGDLLPLYAHLNSADHQVGDQSQWHWLFEERLAGGGGRFRYAMWELRNLRQVARIVEIAGGNGTRAERVLVLVGASHKTALERALATQLSVRVVPADSLLGAGRR